LIYGFVLYVIGFITICLSSKHQRLGDIAAGTMVLRRPMQATPIATKQA